MPDPWAFWTAADIARITGCPVDAVTRNWPLVFAALDRLGIADRPVCMAALGTIAIESASTCEPVREAFWLSEEWRRANLRYYPFYGRGLIQITWRENYQAYGDAIGIDLVADPDRALDPAVAAEILARYFATHGGGPRIPAAARAGDWTEVRRLVQGGTDGLQRLVDIAYQLDHTTSEEPATMAANDPLRVTDAGVRLRSGPGTDAAILATLGADTIVQPLSEHAWREVMAAGQRGWVAADLLAKSADIISGNTQTSTGVELTFDPTTPTELQAQSWTCSIRSTMWLLKSVGIAVTPAEAQDAMSPHYVNSDVGLLDASGAGIVEVLDQRWGVTAHNVSPISFDEAMSLAGAGPLAIGLHNWGGPNHGHWTAVRWKSGAALSLANPGGTGPLYGQQTLNREQFDARAPASAVFIPIG